MMTPEFAKRYFLLTNGRSGSSLLALVMADAGADFGMQAPQQWDPRMGRMENRSVVRAAHHYRRAYDIEFGRKYILSPGFEARFRRSRGRRWLRKALREAEYLKAANMDLLIQPCFRLRYLPQVILIYRRFEPNLASLITGLTHLGPDYLEAEYMRIYRQGLILMQSFGGCAIAYEHLTDPDSQGWASALGRLTGLSESRLLEARTARLKQQPQESLTAVDLYPEPAQLYSTMEEMAGRVFQPVRAVRRDMELRSQ